MTIIPVLDLLRGMVVRGVAGQRDSYQPVESCLVNSADALDVARAIRDELGLNALYVADLDAIINQQPNHAIYQALISDGFDIMLDAGLTNPTQADEALAAGVTQVIAGLETIPGPHFLESLCEKHGPDHVVFSLDLQNGTPLGDTSRWETADPFDIGRQAIDVGIRKMIVLDLSQVGVGQGVPTESLCRGLREASPDLQIITGGGVRNSADLATLNDWQVDGVLVASALHDGRIGRSDIDPFRSSA